jgi:hypothetical protein
MTRENKIDSKELHCTLYVDEKILGTVEWKQKGGIDDDQA